MVVDRINDVWTLQIGIQCDLLGYVSLEDAYQNLWWIVQNK
jgi:hypothetical protein